MKMCEFPGCEHLGGHGPSTPHARWSAELGEWVLLPEQRTRGQIARDARNAKRREKAERIAAEQITINYSAAERLAQYLPESRQEDLRTALSMAALQALTESENAR